MLTAKILRSFTFFPAWKSFHLQIAFPIYRCRYCWIQQSLSLATLSTFTLRKHLWCCTYFFLKLLVKQSNAFVFSLAQHCIPVYLGFCSWKECCQKVLSFECLSLNVLFLVCSLPLHLTDFFFNNFCWVVFWWLPFLWFISEHNTQISVL